ncbi:hypothetical protein LCGC14_2498010 [marine sediment metagenome]|uniref:Uncharacterized protein n=1 Tax=marine sediment metagenome TaxID=412755 RepID=A0A0F9B3J7_9ZZZZ
MNIQQRIKSKIKRLVNNFLKIKNVKNPLNVSIEEYFDNYILAFRINENESSYIGISFLDKNFEEIGDFKKIDVESDKAQDPRIFKFKNDYFLIYNDVLPIEHFARAMHLAKINLKNFIIDYRTVLDQHIKAVEKNFPDIDKFSIEKNPLAKKFFQKYGLLWGH